MTAATTSTGTLVDLLEDRALSGPERPVVADAAGETWTTTRLRDEARARQGAIERVTQAGARVGVVVTDRLEFCAVFFAVQYAGCTPVPLGLAGKRASAAWLDLLQRRVDQLGLHALIADGDVARDVAVALRVPVVAADAVADAGRTARDVAALAIIQPSSGTTGEPRGVGLSHVAVRTNLLMIEEAYAFGPDERLVSWLPMYHDMGLIGTVLAPLHLGSVTTHWPTSSFLRSPLQWLTLLSRVRATIAVVPPFALELSARALARKGASYEGDLSALATVIVGGDRLRPEVLELFIGGTERFGLRATSLCNGYGQAEATLLLASTPVGESPRVVEAGSRLAVTCGRPAPGVELRVEDGSGELLARTPAAMDGYVDDPAMTAATLQDGWMRTGDLATFDAAGDLVLLGRLHDMVNRNGIRLSPHDFEVVAARVEGVEPERVAAFSCEVDGREQVVVVAETPTRADSDAIVLAVRRELGDAGIPANAVVTVGRGALPRTTSGKLRRGAVREMYVAGELTTGGVTE